MQAVGRRERKKNDTHQSLLAAATLLFANRGIYDTTIEEITDAADLGKGTFYKHFESRDAVIAAVLRQGFEQLNARMREQVGADDDPGTVTRMIIAAHARFFTERPEYLLLFHQARGWLKLAGQRTNPVREEFRSYVTVLSDLLAATRWGRTLAAEERMDVARILAGIISGAFSYEIIVGEGNLAAMGLAKALARLGTALAGAVQGPESAG